MLANLDAWHIGGDRPEFTTNFRRRIQFQIESVLMRRSPRQVNHNHRFVGPAETGCRFRLEQLRQGQPSHAERANLDEIAPRYPIAVAARRGRFSENRQHYKGL